MSQNLMNSEKIADSQLSYLNNGSNVFVNFSIFFLIMFVIASNSFLLSPLLPILQAELKVTTIQAGWMVSSYACTYAAFSLLFGPLSDKWNRKTIMIYGLIGYAAALFLCGLSSSWLGIILCQGIAGLFAALITPQVWASITILLPPERLVMGMGIAIGGVSAAQVLGLPAGSFLAGYGWFIPYFTISLLSLMILTLLIWLMPSMPPLEKRQPISLVKGYHSLLKERRSRQGFLAYVIFASGYYAAFTFFGKWLADGFQLDVTKIGMVLLFFGLGSLLGSFFGSPLVTKFTRFYSLNVGAALIAVLYLTLSFISGLISVEILLFVIAAIGGIIIPVILSSLQTLSGSQKGTIAALSNACQYFGAMLGTGMAGILYSFQGFSAVCFFASFMFLLSIFFFVKSEMTIDKKVDE